MTVPDEERFALTAARSLLRELAVPGGFGRIPAHVREEARRALRHYPGETRVDDLFSHDPKWQEYEKMRGGRP
jgi:hypothetical protein